MTVMAYFHCQTGSYFFISIRGSESESEPMKKSCRVQESVSVSESESESGNGNKLLWHVSDKPPNSRSACTSYTRYMHVQSLFISPNRKKDVLKWRDLMRLGDCVSLGLIFYYLRDVRHTCDKDGSVEFLTILLAPPVDVLLCSF